MASARVDNAALRAQLAEAQSGRAQAEGRVAQLEPTVSRLNDEVPMSLFLPLRGTPLPPSLLSLPPDSTTRCR